MSAQELFQEAVRRHEAGELACAEALYRQVLAASPGAPDALHLLGVLCIQRQRFERALELIGQAVAANPGNADYLSNLGVALRALGRHADAVRVLRRALELSPEHPNASYNLSVAERDLGRLDDALAALRTAIAREPDSAERRCDLAGLLLEGGRFEEALDACEETLALDPRSMLAISYKAVALEQAGDREGAASLKGLDRLIRKTRLPVAPGFGSATELCAALARHVRTHPTLTAEPKGKATTGGSQTRELLDGAGLMRTLESAIDAAVADYLAALPADPAHPYLARRPQRWTLTAWGVVLADQGHQAPHLHPRGWVSGVCYVALPAAIRGADAGHEGWIEFGRQPDEIPARVPPESTMILPEEGMLVLFPSYLHHRTVPFRSQEPRISIAFDAYPVWEDGP